MPVLNVDGDRFQYEDEGSGTPVIFVHGSCGGGGQWKGLAGHLKSEYRTICPDLLGSGQSEPWPIERNWSVADDARTLDALLQELDQPAHFVIHSGGGHFAYPTIMKHLGRVRSLTLFEPVYFHVLRQAGDPLFSEPERMANTYRESIEAGDTETAIAGFVDGWAGRQGAWESLPDRVKQSMRLGSNRLYHEWTLPWNEEPSSETLARLDVPVLLFKGSDTIASMHRVCEIITDCRPDCRFVEIEGAGHMSPFTHADDALEPLRMHLAANA